MPENSILYFFFLLNSLHLLLQEKKIFLSKTNVTILFGLDVKCNIQSQVDCCLQETTMFYNLKPPKCVNFGKTKNVLNLSVLHFPNFQKTADKITCTK